MLRTITGRRTSIVNSDEPPPLPPKQTLARVFTYLRPYRKRMAITVSIYMACVVVAMLYPFIDRILIDDHIAVDNPDGFVAILIFAALLHAFNYFGVFIRSSFCRASASAFWSICAGNCSSMCRSFRSGFTTPSRWARR